jgi:exopolysaccharide biosynthesis protein
VLSSLAPAQQPAQVAPTKSESVAPGIEHLQIVRTARAGTGPLFINALKIDSTKARLRMVHAMDAGVGLEAVSSMSARYGALAAINSGFFRTAGVYRGDTMGVGLVDGRLLSETHNARAAVGLIESTTRQQPIFGHLTFRGELTFGNGAKHAIQGLNRPRAENELIVFTPEFHRTTLTDPSGCELIVRNERLVEIRDQKGSSLIPTDGFVISLSGSAREWGLRHARLNLRVDFDLQLMPTDVRQTELWKRATSIVGGGPQLIKDGRVDITNAAEKIAPAFVNDLHPRTAIATLRSGEVLLITVDGRQPRHSIGISLNSLAELLIEFGAVEAINLDGGGSTAMVIRNKLVNKPSDAAGERPVSDAILVFSRQP